MAAGPHLPSDAPSPTLQVFTDAELQAAADEEEEAAAAAEAAAAEAAEAPADSGGDTGGAAEAERKPAPAVAAASLAPSPQPPSSLAFKVSYCPVLLRMTFPHVHVLIPFLAYGRCFRGPVSARSWQPGTRATRRKP